MHIRRLGATDLDLSVVGVGTAAAGGRGWPGSWGEQSDETSIAAVRRAIALGANWVDTAPVYGFGHAERIVGQAIAGLPERVQVLTKCGVSWQDGSPRLRLRGPAVREDVEASLERLQRDQVDVCLIHFPEPEDEIDEGWASLVALKEQGLVRHVGLSNFTLEQIQRAHAAHPVEVIELSYSLLERASEHTILPFAEREEIGVVVYRALAAGLLTTAALEDRFGHLDPDDWRGSDPAFREPELSRNVAECRRVARIAEQRGYSVEQFAVAWTLRQAIVTSAIIGFRTPTHADRLLGGFDIEAAGRVGELAEGDAQSTERE